MDRDPVQAPAAQVVGGAAADVRDGRDGALDERDRLVGGEAAWELGDAAAGSLPLGSPFTYASARGRRLGGPGSWRW